MRFIAISGPFAWASAFLAAVFATRERPSILFAQPFLCGSAWTSPLVLGSVYHNDARLSTRRAPLVGFLRPALSRCAADAHRARSRGDDSTRSHRRYRADRDDRPSLPALFGQLAKPRSSAQSSREALPDPDHPWPSVGIGVVSDRAPSVTARVRLRPHRSGRLGTARARSRREYRRPLRRAAGARGRACVP